MTVRSIGEYDFPAAEPRANFGTDLLVYVYFEGNHFFGSANTFRLPPDLPWGAFRSEMLDPWAAIDPDTDPARFGNWRADDVAFEPGEADTLASLGIGWKSVVRFDDHATGGQ